MKVIEQGSSPILRSGTIAPMRHCHQQNWVCNGLACVHRTHCFAARLAHDVNILLHIFLIPHGFNLLLRMLMFWWAFSRERANHSREFHSEQKLKKGTRKHRPTATWLRVGVLRVVGASESVNSRNAIYTSQVKQFLCNELHKTQFTWTSGQKKMMDLFWWHKRSIGSLS